MHEIAVLHYTGDDKIFRYQEATVLIGLVPTLHMYCYHSTTKFLWCTDHKPDECVKSVQFVTVYHPDSRGHDAWVLRVRNKCGEKVLRMIVRIKEDHGDDYDHVELMQKVVAA